VIQSTKHASGYKELRACSCSWLDEPSAHTDQRHKHYDIFTRYICVCVYIILFC